MGELHFVGLGLSSKGVSIEGLEELKAADAVYLEYYTMPHDPELLGEVQRATDRQVVVVDRNFVEDGSKILEEASKMRVALAVMGDPMIATTHNELRVRAIGKGIRTRVISAASIASASASASGLHYYKFSRTVTITRETVGRLTQAYHLLHQNLLEGAHTLILLEFDTASGEGVAPAEAMDGLMKAESNFKREVVSESTMALVLSRVGRKSEKLAAGELGELRGRDFGEPPHSLVIPGTLHFTEVDAVAAICSIDKIRVKGNSDTVRRTAQVLVPRYVEKTKKALASVRGRVGKEYEAVLENAELYLKDAENNLASGEDEVAMLNVGYAEGLIDSLSFSGKAEPTW